MTGSNDLGSVDGGEIFFLSGCDLDIIKESLQTLIDKLVLSSGKAVVQPVVIGCKPQFSCLTNVQGLPQYFASLCRRYRLMRNDRFTLLSAMDQLVALQLCLAERNKEDKGDYDVETSVVIQTGKDITNQKLSDQSDVTSCTENDGNTEEYYEIAKDYGKFLLDCNYADSCDVFNIAKQELEKNEELRREMRNQSFIFLDIPKNPVERHMLKFLCCDKKLHSVSIEVPLNSTDDLCVTHGDCCLDTVLGAGFPQSTAKKPVSVTEAYVRQVYLSYLDLLVNSRSELALSRVINVPEREITHTAFTDLKHESKQKNLTMYQTATSYLMKLRLGGKGYAPDPNSRLAPHIKGIGEFVSLMQRMETVIEEDPNIRSACQRAVNVLRREMVKCKDSRLRVVSVEAVAGQLQDQITSIIDHMDSLLVNTPGKSAADGGSLTSRRARKALRHLLDKLATSDGGLSTINHLTDMYSSQQTPIRFPSVLSQFRSPEEELETTSPTNKYNQSLSERVMINVNRADTPLYAKRYRSCLDWAEPLHNVDLPQEQDVFRESQVFVIPSKTIVHAGNKLSTGEAKKVLESLMDQENVTDSDPPTVTAVTKKTASLQLQNNATKKNKKADTKKAEKTKSTKRPLDCDTVSSQPQKKKKQEATKPVRRKLLPQVKGQQSLMNFFRV